MLDRTSWPANTLQFHLLTSPIKGCSPLEVVPCFVLDTKRAAYRVRVERIAHVVDDISEFMQ